MTYLVGGFNHHSGLSKHGIPLKTGGFPINNGYQLEWFVGTIMVTTVPKHISQFFYASSEAWWKLNFLPAIQQDLCMSLNGKHASGRVAHRNLVVTLIIAINLVAWLGVS